FSRKAIAALVGSSPTAGTRSCASGSACGSSSTTVRNDRRNAMAKKRTAAPEALPPDPAPQDTSATATVAPPALTPTSPGEQASDFILSQRDPANDCPF